MKKTFLFLISLMLLFSLSYGDKVLNDVIQDAQPASGYDKLLILDPNEVYTGGLIIVDTKVGIWGNGAILDLQSDSIAVRGNSQINLDGCIITNGGNAISVGVNENVTSMINQCTFYNNGIAIRFMTKTGAIEVVNTILSNNSIYGFACSHETARTLHYSDAYSNGSNYVEWCPG
ncbi:MAG: hypothetical protein KAR38_14725 [Calditrichia bacterium]|nr:hypothetical protein [Calditrichia bacterium]